MVKNPPANAGDARDLGLIPGLGRSSGEGNGNPLQYSCLENSMDRGALWAIVHEVGKRHKLSTHRQRKHASLLASGVFSNPWPSLACKGITCKFPLHLVFVPGSESLCISPFSPKDTSHIRLGPTLVTSS